MKKKILFITALFFLLPFKVDALSGSLNLSCNKTKLLPNESATCTITGSSDSEVSTVSAKVKVGNNLILGNVITSSIWEGNGEGGSIDLYTDTNKKGSFAIATFTITAKTVLGNVNVSVDSIVYSDANFLEFNIPTATKTINIYEKEIEVPEEKPDGGGETNNPPKPSNPGGSGNTQPSKSNDASLKSLTIDVENFNFNPNVLEYSLEVNYTKKKVSIQAIANDSKATVTLPDNYDLKVGSNIFEIKVVAEDGTTRFYKININRLERILSNNAYLSNITIDNYPIEFDKVKTSYQIDKIKEKNLKLKIETEDENATYEVYGNSNLNNNDVIVIKVKAEDGTIKEYTIYINEVYHKQSYDFGVFFLILVMLSSISMNIVYILANKNKKKKI